MFDNEYTGEEDFPYMQVTEDELKQQEEEVDEDHKYNSIHDDDASVTSQVSDLSNFDDLSLSSSIVGGGGDDVDSKRLKRIRLPDARDAVNRTIQQLSPRTKYIDNCLKNGVVPRAGLLVRKKLSQQLSMKSQGIGDKMAILVAESIQNAPFIHSLDISDNRLTDKGLEPILLAAISMTSLLELDMSKNKLGKKTSEKLAEYLASDECSLIRLGLREADVDDGECENFVTALRNNKTLRELDLSSNMLGSAEQLNTVMPDLTTGGEALAEWLSDPSCKLESLKVAWNMIRLDSAVALSSSFHTNTSLTYLDLSYNALGHDGGLTLGDAIIDNTSLKSLILANNQIDAAACFTLSIGTIENRVLTKLNLDGNPIGENGSRALVLVPMTVGDRCSVSARNCNVIMRNGQNNSDDGCNFDISNPTGTYVLQLTHPFQRAVAFALLRMVANHPTRIFREVKCNGVVVDLEQSIRTESIEFMNQKRRSVVENLRAVVNSASNLDAATKLFKDTDTDGSGYIDVDELHVLMSSIGINMTRDGVESMMAAVDIDGGGEMDEAEFYVLLKSIARDARNKLKDLLETLVMSEVGKPQGEQYRPPRDGVIEIDVIEGLTGKKLYRNLSVVDNNHAKALAEQSGKCSCNDV